jgi:FAD/FMN-containing dehydrogenases
MGNITEKQAKLAQLRKHPLWWDMPEDAYKEMEAVVGSAKISKEKTVRAAYVGRGYARELIWYAGQAYPPCCVVQPETTEEVAGIVKVCNKYNIPFVPCSSQWAYNANPRFRPDMVQIDLQNMLTQEFDTKNLYAKVGTGIRYGQFCQACFEHDTYFINTGGGSASCVVANHTVWGCSPLNYRMGNSEKRTLSVTWVTPEGDIVRTGSWAGRDITLENGFMGDGYGPNINGIWRGHVGWFGAMGIVTEITVKIFPFIEDAAKKMVGEGVSPDSTIAFKTDRVAWQNFKLPTRKALEDVMYEFGDAEIGAAVTKVPVFWRVIAKMKDKEDFWERWSGVTKNDVDTFHMCRALFIGYTNDKQMEYEKKVLEDIIKEYKAEATRTKPSDESWFKNADVSGMWSMTNGYSSCEAGQESLRCTYETGKALGKRLEEKYTPPFMAEFGDPGWFQSNDLGHNSYLEFLVYMNVDRCDPMSEDYDPVYLSQMIPWYFEETPEIDATTGFLDFFPASCHGILYQGPYYHDYQVWTDRFKEEFDPRTVSNPPAPFDPEMITEMLPPFMLTRSRRWLRTAKRGKSMILGKASSTV